MGIKRETPCQYCAKRTQACHTDCMSYIEYILMLKREKEAKQLLNVGSYICFRSKRNLRNDIWGR